MRATGKTTEKPRAAARKAYKAVMTDVLAAEGRRSFSQKARLVASVTRKAVRAGSIAGLATAAAVIARQVRRRRV